MDIKSRKAVTIIKMFINIKIDYSFSSVDLDQ